ncbi:long-chain fatty acid--CoA ligase [Domibacillus antri]|uniref:Long-chain fatty acid--CoA ligase n=1 Tax=Domibacillus antri TaxID=1714264 RepID=A0A1Q8Q5N4_9BACI|nr:long-chain-fatty-acid--CoA ligase [Domibacillus antri]OLN22638.1 long-chain fatty acid--CoA ligase [Domibacillus antri]
MTEKPWLAHYPPEIPAAIDYPDQPLPLFLTKAAAEYGGKMAVHFLGKELSYKELYDSALKTAAYLKKIGIQKGDRVAIMLPNSPQAVISFYGVMIAGAVVVQFNPLYTEREMEYQLKDCGAKVIISLDLLYPRIQKIISNTSLEHVIVTAIKDYLPFPKNMIYPFIQKKQTGIVVQIENRNNNHHFKKIMEEPVPKEEPLNIDVDNDPAVLQYTGGTTGFPKGVMLTHKNLVANASMCDVWMYKFQKGGETILGIIPFFHVYGMTTVMILSVMQGYKMVLLPKFDVKTTLKTIQKQKPTIFPGAPTIYIALLNDPDITKYDLSSIDACISGSAPLPVDVQQKFEDVTGGKLVEGYGLTETSPVTHANFIWGDRVKGSIGVPWPDTDAVILSMQTNEPAGKPGELGEIAVKGPQVMKGYWNRPEETEQTFKDGWFLTGDIGYMDESGYFYIVDRKKDMIIAGGFNIYPRDVEEVLYEHEAIQEAVVAGVPDPYRGETVKAYIVLKEGYKVTEQEFDDYCRKHLAAFKVPRIYEFREELPKTAVGKILRRVLIEEEKKKLEEKTS